MGVVLKCEEAGASAHQGNHRYDIMSERPELGGEGYQRILKVSVRDARLYRWRESVCMISAVGVLVGLGTAICVPVQDWRDDSVVGWMHYLVSLVLLPAPFAVCFVGGAIVHRRLGRRYGDRSLQKSASGFS